jgi:hypothetical protein
VVSDHLNCKLIILPKEAALLPAAERTGFPSRILYEYLRTYQVDTARAKPEQLAAPFADCIKQSLSGIATPERIEQLTDDLQKTAREWLHKGKSEGALLQIESNWLADDPSNDHPFIYTLFAGQLRSLGEAPCAKAK